MKKRMMHLAVGLAIVMILGGIMLYFEKGPLTDTDILFFVPLMVIPAMFLFQAALDENEVPEWLKSTRDQFYTEVAGGQLGSFIIFALACNHLKH